VEVVIPARNEEKRLPGTCRALISQSLLPSRIILLHDGEADHNSTCSSCKIVRALPHSELFEVVHIDHPSWRQRGTPEMAELFNIGFSHVSSSADYVMILGADHVISCNYIKQMVSNMKRDDVRLASGTIGSSKAVIPRGSGRVIHIDTWEEVMGQPRYPLSYGFETYPVLKFQMCGYKTAVYGVPSHLTRMTGGSTNYVNYGRGMKFLGYTKKYALTRALITAIRFRNPSKGIQMIVGYLTYPITSDVAKWFAATQDELISKYFRSPKGVPFLGKLLGYIRGATGSGY